MLINKLKKSQKCKGARIIQGGQPPPLNTTLQRLLFNPGINTLDATRHISGVRTYIALIRHVPLKWRLEKSRQKPIKIQFEPEIVAVRDGLYCRVNFTVRLAVHSLLSGRTSIVKCTTQ